MRTSIKEPILENLPPDLLQAIGEVATRWSLFELYLDTEIWFLLELLRVEAGACVTAQIPNSGRKLDAIIAIAENRGCSSKLLKELRSFASKSDGLQRKRNRVVHDVWVATVAGTHYRFEITAQKTLIFEHKPIPLPEVKAVTSEIENHIRSFVRLKESVFRELVVVGLDVPFLEKPL